MIGFADRFDPFEQVKQDLQALCEKAGIPKEVLQIAIEKEELEKEEEGTIAPLAIIQMEGGYDHIQQAVNILFRFLRIDDALNDIQIYRVNSASVRASFVCDPEELSRHIQRQHPPSSSL